jgi:hypothetical protein
VNKYEGQVLLMIFVGNEGRIRVVKSVTLASDVPSKNYSKLIRGALKILIALNCKRNKSG